MNSKDNEWVFKKVRQMAWERKNEKERKSIVMPQHLIL